MASSRTPIIEAAKAQFQKRLDGGLRRVEIPEWPDAEGKPSVLWIGPENTQQRDEYFPLMRENKYAGFVKFLLVRARTEEGKRAFTPSDEITLMKATDPDIIVQIVHRMEKVIGEEVAVDEAGKS